MSDVNSSSTVTLEDARMVSVPKEFFFDGMPLPVSVYLRMKKDTYILIGKQRDRVNFIKLHSFQNKESRVFVRKEDQPVLIHFVTKATEKMVVQENVPPALKGKFISGLVTNSIGQFEVKGVASAAHMQKVSDLLVVMSETVAVFDEISKILASLPNDDVKHGMATCLMSLLIADEMGHNHRAAQEKLALGSLLQDVGLKFVPKEILTKARHLWTPDETTTYEQHPIKGVEMLRDIRDLSNDVLLIIAESHENAHGTGFPKKLRDVKISPLGRIVIVASYFASLLYNRMPDGRDYTADEAITYMEEILGQPFNKQVFLALKNIINKKHLHDKLAG